MAQPYLVLARKYRPQKFADLTGQEHVVRTLVNALRTGRVAHAFLFTGPRGCGKTTSARILARALNCVGADGKLEQPSPEPCGACTPCLEIAAGTDVDVQEIDAASNNGVDDVRALREAAKYLPARDRYKVYIVDEVHMLSGAAFNALLKTLEEPPGHIKFLLATTDPQKLPATILSRVQRHNIQLVPLGKIVTRLREIVAAEGLAASDGALSLVARQAQGSMRDALSLLDQLLSAHDPAAGEIGDAEAAEILGALDRQVVAGTLSAVLRRDAAGALAGVQRAYEAGADFRRFGEELCTQARNLVVSSLQGVRSDLPDHEVRALAAEAAAHDPAQLSRVFELLQSAQEAIGKAPVPRHAVEVMLLRAVYLAPSSALPDLAARLDALSQRLGGAGLQGAAQGGQGQRPSGSAGAAPARPLASEGASAPRGFEQGPAGPQRGGPRSLDESAPHAGAGGVRAGLALVGAALESPRAAPEAVAPPSPPPPQLHAVPAPAAAPAGEHLPFEQRWRVLVESVRAARKQAAAAVLEHGVPLAIGPVVKVGFRKGFAGVLEDRDVRASVEAAFERVLGHKVTLQLVDHAPAAATPAGSAAPGEAQAKPAATSMADQREKARRERVEQRKAMGREHPNVKAALELLGGEIEDVKDLGEE